MSTYAELLGIRTIKAENGSAHTAALVQKEHINHVGFAHGAFINSIADVALELASNSHDKVAVAISSNIQYYRPAAEGETLEAFARETHLGKTTATYFIEVKSGSKLIATFTGTVFRK